MEFTIVARNFKYPRRSLSKEIGPGFYSYGGYTEGRDFGEKFELIKSLLKGVDVKEKLLDSEPEAITSRLEEEEAWRAEDELFELWIVHTIIREDEQSRKEREGGRSFFTQKRNIPMTTNKISYMTRSMTALKMRRKFTTTMITIGMVTIAAK